MKKLLTAASLLALTALPGWADPVRIGFITTLSGSGGYLGQDARDAFQMVIDQGGGKLGGHEVTLVVEDDGLNPGNGRQIANKFVNDEGIKIVTGVIFSNVLGAVVPDVIDNDAFYLSLNAAPSNLSGKDCHENYFVVSWQNDSLHEATGVAARKLGYHKVIALAPNYQAGKDAIEGFKRTFEGEVEEIYTQLDQTDFASEMARIRAANPEMVFQFHPGGLGIAFLKQYQQAGLLGQIPMVLSEPSLDAVIIKAVGDAAIGIKGTARWSVDFQNPASQAFVAAWKEKYGDRPVSYYAQQGYDTALLIASALAKAMPDDDPDAFREALRAADFASTRGNFKFGQNQHPIQSWYLTEVVMDENGVPVTRTVEQLLDMVGDAYADQCQM